MPTQMKRRHLIWTGNLLVFVLALIFVSITACQPFPQKVLSGWLYILWGNGPAGSDRGSVKTVLIDDRGQWYHLLLDEKLTKPYGGPLALNGKRVKVVLDPTASTPVPIIVLSITLEKIVQDPPQQAELLGWFRVLWYDGPPGSQVGGLEYWLDVDQGPSYRLQIDDKLLKPFGEARNLDGKRVKVILDLTATTPGPILVLSIELQ